MGNFKEKLQRFMMGRYGVDQLGKTLLYVSVILLILDIIFRTNLFFWLAVVLLVFCYVRMFSKNYSQRSAENAAYLRFTGKVKGVFTRKKNEAMDREHRIFSCPNCKQRIRVPRGKGKISIHCPKCGTDFIKRT
ncbi:MAG: hypothetical protein ACLU61_06890 [Lachnospiraceae bacterium]